MEVKCSSSESFLVLLIDKITIVTIPVVLCFCCIIGSVVVSRYFNRVSYRSQNSVIVTTLVLTSIVLSHSRGNRETRRRRAS